MKFQLEEYYKKHSSCLDFVEAVSLLKEVITITEETGVLM
jgi:hypothetical protein